MKKICQLTSVHPRNDTRIFLKECTSLAAAGWEVHLVVADGKGDDTLNGVFIHDVGKPSGRLDRFIGASKKVYKKGLEIDAELYHFHDPELCSIGLKLMRKGKKVIYDVHEDLPRQILSKHYINALLRKPLAFFVELYENFAARRFSYVITATPYIQKRFEKLNKASENVNNYPLLNELDTELSDWNERKNEVCYVGNITKIRGLEYVVGAMNQLNGIVFKLAGSFTPNNLKEELAAIPGWDKTDGLGQINRQEVKAVMKSAKAGIVTFLPYGNHVHAQPNKLFEYMSQGIPVIASHFPLWKSIVEGYQCGICVDPANPDEIAEAIRTILGDDQKARSMGERGREAVLQKYNWGFEEKKLIEVYEHLTN